MADVGELLGRHFGFKEFRPGQREVIEHVLAGNDAIVLMPTGGGKSLCYQIPALAMDGLAIVVSPLIALMKDQVQALQGNGIAAAYLNSSLDFQEEMRVLDQLRNGKLKLLYVSPERLFQFGFLDRIREWNVSLFAIDEAHCISSWGHHFRPEYKHLGILKKEFPKVPVIALTATADKAVRSDIGIDLGMHDSRTFISSFDRPNLSLAVQPGQDRWRSIQRIVGRYANKCGIIYCNSRASAEKLAERLRSISVRAAHYHAKMDPQERSRTQDDFIQGRLHVVCATIAFGMGIDKADIRYVIHYNMPGTLEGFYQEIGRAGRDGAPAETILFYSYADVQTHMHFMEEVQHQQYKDILLAKLDRMKEYAEAQVCRRNILLSYFSEEVSAPCGNCDVCKDPPKYLDGTVHAQMALSAVARSLGQLSLSTLVDVLKGSFSTEVVEKNWQRIKTFGAGTEISAFVWLQYIQQFIQLGLLEVDYRDHHHLKLTRAGEMVLRGERKVELVSVETIRERQERSKKQRVTTSTAPVTNSDLLSELKTLRRAIATEIGKPAFVVFSDATLIDMAEKQPIDLYQFRLVNGVGDHKVQQYGERFVKAIKNWRSPVHA
jgi:ATP-dependent DNA helicase RecQ